MWGSAVQICSGLRKWPLRAGRLRPWEGDGNRRGDDDRSSLSGGLAQLARAPALQAGGRRFDSDILHHAADAEQFFTSGDIWGHTRKRRLQVERFGTVSSTNFSNGVVLKETKFFDIL